MWINPHNTMPVRVRVVDPIEDGAEFVPDSLSCQAMGASQTWVCLYNAEKRQIEWLGIIAPDPGATSQENAQNEVVITFKIKLTDTTVKEVHNETTAYWDVNGDGAVDQRDTQVAFPMTATGLTRKAPTTTVLPQTGFLPKQQPTISRRTEAPQRSSSLWLEIPTLKVKAPIYRTRRDGLSWDVSWLWTQVGWLEGTAFPTHRGNSVLAGHVTLASGRPGPFAHLQELKTGDVILIRAWDRWYTYVVRRSERVLPDDTTPLQPKPSSWVTLVTCEGYDRDKQTYRWRRVVQAELLGTSARRPSWTHLDLRKMK